MATWITHLMIADKVLSRIDGLDRLGFCVGNIAPDCNVENEDWTAFTPSREVTHWMRGERKLASDCEGFYEEYLCSRAGEIKSEEHRAFLMGYYCHLLTDAAFQKLIRDEARVRAVWRRIYAKEDLREKAANQPQTWDTVKKIIPKAQRMGEIYALEAEYLAAHPESGYLTQILPLKEFPDYLDYLPQGAIVRKIGIMGWIPEVVHDPELITMSREELLTFVENTVNMVIGILKEKSLI